MAPTTVKQNTIRRPERAPKEEPPKKAWTLNFDQVFSDKRNNLTLGVLMMMLSGGLFFAFVSYLFNGQADQSTINAAFRAPLRETGEETRNWLGLAGAYIAHVFVFRWFGVGALGLPVIAFLAGCKVAFGTELLPLRRTTKAILFLSFWISLLLGYIVLVTDSVQDYSIWCGGLGYELNVALYGLIGWGNVALIGFLLFCFVVFFFNVTSLQWPSRSTNTSAPSPRPSTTRFDRVEDSYDDIDDEILADEIPEPAPVAVVEPAPPTAPAAPVAEETTRELSLPTPASAPRPAAKPGSLTFTIEDTTAVVEAESITPVFDVEPVTGEDLLSTHGLYDPTLDLPRYQFPTAELLTDYPESQKAQVGADELEANKDRIVETLQNYGITIDHIKATIGPTVTLYEIVPSAGVRISKIKSLEDDIALNLAALGIRIIAPMPGKGTIGIEVPNKNREMVSIRSVMTSDKFAKSTYELPVVLGKTISNEIYVADLAKMPHLLMAGATGQGKSVGLNVLLTSLIYKKHPSQLKLVLVDPKKVELTLFNKLERHFLAKLPDSDEAIITDTKKVVNTLNSLCIEMDNRYNLLKDAGCRNLKEYNAKFVQRRLSPEKGHRFLPYIVLIVDELADLMMTAGKEVEQPIARLAQLARAIGIHLVVATQRPSVNVITGLIKANFPARLSFKVTSKIDSRTILDTGGAEQLVGMGDMLLSSNSDLIRLQCPFVDTNEIEEICDFVGNQRGYEDAYALPEFVGDDGGIPDDKDVDLENRDPMFDEAARLVVIHQQGSTSLIQRRLKLGYNRAGRLIDQLEAAGIVGPFEGSKAREVLIHDTQVLEERLKEMS
ncbi:DNA translocase FtsK [Nibrella saemangeumensis]|uniref:DNA translocase FtsK n=1 Tax=Nibrella saemangeumensis TaxID=1084526 RepID=A0ABP8N6T4_9BACT